MKIYINDKSTEISAQNLAELAAELNLPEHGVAIALGRSMIQRPFWTDTPLNEGDKVIIIKAACGG